MLSSSTKLLWLEYSTPLSQNVHVQIWIWFVVNSIFGCHPQKTHEKDSFDFSFLIPTIIESEKKKRNTISEYNLISTNRSYKYYINKQVTIFDLNRQFERSIRDSCWKQTSYLQQVMKFMWNVKKRKVKFL